MKTWFLFLLFITVPAFAQPNAFTRFVPTDLPTISPLIPTPTGRPEVGPIQPTAPGPKFLINPLSVPDQCLSWFERRVTDHRTNPPTVTYQFITNVANCGAGTAARTNSQVYITYLRDGTPYNGQAGDVQIQLAGPVPYCLTNPSNYVTNPLYDQELRWEPCAPLNSGSTQLARQIFYLWEYSNGALLMYTQLEQIFHPENWNIQCIERITPQTVGRVACAAPPLHNWMLTRL